MRGGRELQQDPADPRVGVERVEKVLDLGLGGAGGQIMGKALDPDLQAGPLLVGHVHRRGGILADEHRRQARARAAGGRPGLHLLARLAADLGGDRLAVDDLALIAATQLHLLTARFQHQAS